MSASDWRCQTHVGLSVHMLKLNWKNGTLSLTGIFHSLSDPTILKVHHKTRSQQYPGFEMAEGSGYGGP